MLGQIHHPHGIPLTLYGDRFGALVRNDDHWSIEEQLEELGIAFIAAHNARFALPARKVARDNTASIPGRWIQLPPRAHGRSWQGCWVEVRECLDGPALVMEEGGIVARQGPLHASFTLVNREDRRAKERCPENFASVPRAPVVAGLQTARGDARESRQSHERGRP